MSLDTARRLLIAAGIRQDDLDPIVNHDGAPGLFIRYDDLPHEGVSAKIDAAMKSIEFEMGDKGIIVLGEKA